MKNSQQIPAALIRRPGVQQLTALSRSQIYFLMKQGKFPKPARLGTMSVAWHLPEIETWIAARLAERDAA